MKKSANVQQTGLKQRLHFENVHDVGEVVTFWMAD